MTTASVVVCAYTTARCTQIVRALESVQRQSLPPLEVILVVDHNEELLAWAKTAVPTVLVVENAEVRGLSGARNTGVKKSSGDVVAFLDDDAWAADDWLLRLVGCFESETVMGVGSDIRPVWATGRPRWFPPEYDWVVGCSYTGLPTRPAQIRNPIGAAMAFRREVFDEVGGFETSIGRVGALPVGCEETEFSLRAARRWPQRRIMLEPSAMVHHEVSADREALRYFLRRCWSEGISKAVVSQLASTGAALRSEGAYVTRTLPAGAARDLQAAAVGRDLASAARVVASLAGVMAAAAGYGVGTVRSARSARSSRSPGQRRSKAPMSVRD